MNGDCVITSVEVVSIIVGEVGYSKGDALNCPKVDSTFNNFLSEQTEIWTIDKKQYKYMGTFTDF